VLVTWHHRKGTQICHGSCVALMRRQQRYTHLWLTRNSKQDFGHEDIQYICTGMYSPVQGRHTRYTHLRGADGGPQGRHGPVDELLAHPDGATELGEGHPWKAKGQGGEQRTEGRNKELVAPCALAPAPGRRGRLGEGHPWKASSKYTRMCIMSTVLLQVDWDAQIAARGTVGCALVALRYYSTVLYSAAAIEAWCIPCCSKYDECGRRSHGLVAGAASARTW